jgi:hypothetical protein
MKEWAQENFEGFEQKPQVHATHHKQVVGNVAFAITDEIPDECFGHGCSKAGC